MKSKDLISKILAIDPEGTMEVCVDNHDIHFLHEMPSYWDGRLELLERDQDGHPIGAKVTSKGNKIKIKYLSIEDAIFENPELPVDLSECGIERSRQEYAANIEKWRTESRSLWKDHRDRLKERE